MSKEIKDESSGVNWTYGGGEEEWDAFDRWMIRYMRGKLDVFGERLWKGDIEDITKMAAPEFANYVLVIYESLRIAQPKLAKELKKKGSEFYLKSWHIQWLRRQCDLMLDHIEDQAIMEIVNYNGDKNRYDCTSISNLGQVAAGTYTRKRSTMKRGCRTSKGLHSKLVWTSP
jgi:hypothetical protein